MVKIRYWLYFPQIYALPRSCCLHTKTGRRKLSPSALKKRERERGGKEENLLACSGAINFHDFLSTQRKITRSESVQRNEVAKEIALEL